MGESHRQGSGSSMNLQHYISPSKFLINALGMEADKGTHHGVCVTCGIETNHGHTLKEGFNAITTPGFTDWNRCAVMDINGIVCESCTMMNKSHSSQIVSLYRSRLRRCCVTESGKILMIGTDRRLKWVLQNLPNEPFLLMDSRKSPAKFMHHIWCSRVSLDKKGFYYCDDAGNHFIRTAVIYDDHAIDKTPTEQRLSNILRDDSKIAEQPYSPDHPSYK